MSLESQPAGSQAGDEEVLTANAQQWRICR